MNLKLASIIMIALVMMPLVGCTPAQTTDIVQKVVNVFSIGKQYVAAASSLVPELQQVNPQLAAEVSEYASLAGTNLDNLIAIGNAYLSKPSAAGYQALLNGADALSASIDSKVLAAAKITNPQSQAKIMAILGLASASIHVIVGVLIQNAPKGQVKAMPVITSRVDWKELQPIISASINRSRLITDTMEACDCSNKRAERVMESYGL